MGCCSYGVARSIIPPFRGGHAGSNPATSIHFTERVNIGPPSNYDLMTRSPEDKKPRIEFVATSEAQKQKIMLDAKDLGYTTSEYIRQACEEKLTGQTVSSSADERRDKLLAEKDAEIEQLRAALGMKKNVNTQLNVEVKMLRERLYGNYGYSEQVEIAYHLEEVIKENGTLSRKQLLTSIDDSHKVKNLVQTIEEVVSRLRLAGKILVGQEGEIQWVG